QVFQIRADRVEALVVELVEPACALGRGDHKPGFLEQPQMARDGRAGDRHVVGDLAHRPRPAVQKLEDRAAVRIGERLERGRGRLGHGVYGSRPVTVTLALLWSTQSLATAQRTTPGSCGPHPANPSTWPTATPKRTRQPSSASSARPPSATSCAAWRTCTRC